MLEQCGPYLLTITPAQRYLYPRYIMDSVWLSVKDTDGNTLWKGRTNNKIAALVSNLSPFLIGRTFSSQT